jgi:hypothetical protein
MAGSSSTAENGIGGINMQHRAYIALCARVAAARLVASNVRAAGVAATGGKEEWRVHSVSGR